MTIKSAHRKQIVDFCCGANDFSVLVKKKLDETGKRCSYKNFDLIPPKVDLPQTFTFQVYRGQPVRVKTLLICMDITWRFCVLSCHYFNAVLIVFLGRLSHPHGKEKRCKNIL